MLPENVDLSKPGNPLDNHPTWKYTKCKKTGMKAIKTDTLDTFFDSSWYYLRFCSPDNEDKPFDSKALNTGCQSTIISAEWSMQFTFTLSGFFLER